MRLHRFSRPISTLASVSIPPFTDVEARDKLRAETECGRSISFAQTGTLQRTQGTSATGAPVVRKKITNSNKTLDRAKRLLIMRIHRLSTMVDKNGSRLLLCLPKVTSPEDSTTLRGGTLCGR
jgi:hypothetical protein